MSQNRYGVFSPMRPVGTEPALTRGVVLADVVQSYGRAMRLQGLFLSDKYDYKPHARACELATRIHSRFLSLSMQYERRPF